MGDPDLTPLRALALADEAPYVPIPRLLARGVDLVLCLGDLTRQDLEPLADVQLPKLGVYGNHDDGGEFDGLWLRSMIKHHQGAVTMAQHEVAHGQNADAVKMAKIIVDWQQLEIGQMTKLASVPE